MSLAEPNRRFLVRCRVCNSGHYVTPAALNTGSEEGAGSIYHCGLRAVQEIFTSLTSIWSSELYVPVSLAEVNTYNYAESMYSALRSSSLKQKATDCFKELVAAIGQQCAYLVHWDEVRRVTLDDVNSKVSPAITSAATYPSEVASIFVPVHAAAMAPPDEVYSIIRDKLYSEATVKNVLSNFVAMFRHIVDISLEYGLPEIVASPSDIVARSAIYSWYTELHKLRNARYVLYKVDRFSCSDVPKMFRNNYGTVQLLDGQVTFIIGQLFERSIKVAVAFPAVVDRDAAARQSTAFRKFLPLFLNTFDEVVSILALLNNVRPKVRRVYAVPDCQPPLLDVALP